MKDWNELVSEFADAEQDGLTAAFTALLAEEGFRSLVGCMATVYGVTVRKVTSIDQRSFAAAKQKIATFCARTSGWNAKISRSTRNGSWSRGQVHPANQVEGRSDQGDLVSMGGRGSGVRSASSKTPDSPPQGAAPRRPQVKDSCPTCQRPTHKVWRAGALGLVCPGCVRRKRGDE